jgi:hypothetical protein
LIKTQLARLEALETYATEVERGCLGIFMLNAADFATEAEQEAFTAECKAQMCARGYNETLTVVFVPADAGRPAPRPVESSAEPWVRFPWDEHWTMPRMRTQRLLKSRISDNRGPRLGSVSV